MNREEFNKLVELMEAQEHHLLKTKGDDYTQKDNDRLINFKRIGQEIKGSPLFNTHPELIVWWIYFRKHIDAMQSFIKSGNAESEPIEGRVCDARNYLGLGLGLLVDAGFVKMKG